MPMYYILKQFDEDYPTVKELAARLARDYGIVNRRGLPHNDFVRAYLEEDLQKRQMPRLLRNSVPRVYVYQNSDSLFALAEEILPELEEKKSLAVPVRDVLGNGRIKIWNLFWFETVRQYKYRKISLSNYPVSCYYRGKTLKIA